MHRKALSQQGVIGQEQYETQKRTIRQEEEAKITYRI